MAWDKSVGVAYLLWFFGGGFGLHLLYLGRDRQAFIWWATWGGFAGIGWLRDIFYIPQYVGLYNGTHAYVEEVKHEEKRRQFPPWSAFRFFGEIAFGFLTGFLAQYAIPDELFDTTQKVVPIYSYLLLLVGPFGSGLSVYLVANIGREQCSWKYPILSAYLAYPLIVMAPTNLIYSAIISAIFTAWKGPKWRPLSSFRPKKHFCKRLLVLTACGIIYLSFWSSAIYFNASITTKEGDEVKVREAVHHFFRSPAWLEMKEIMSQLYQNIQTVGWAQFFQSIIEAIDPQGETNALKVLGVDSNATQKEIHSAYKKLVVIWHPDKNKDPALKDEFEKKFLEIQQAYEKLSDIKAKRSARAKTSN